MREIEAADTDLSSLLARVEQGEAVTILRDGRAVAQVVPMEANLLHNHEAIERLREWRRKQRPQHLSVEEIIEMRDEGRR